MGGHKNTSHYLRVMAIKSISIDSGEDADDLEDEDTFEPADATVTLESVGGTTPVLLQIRVHQDLLSYYEVGKQFTMNLVLEEQ